MTTLEYAYTERDIYTAIVHTAVPIALTADETALLVADVIALAETMPHDTPAGVFYAYQFKISARDAVLAPRRWQKRIEYLKIDANRTAALVRIRQQYPGLDMGVKHV